MHTTAKHTKKKEEKKRKRVSKVTLTACLQTVHDVTWALCVISSRCCSVNIERPSTSSFSHGSLNPGPSLGGKKGAVTFHVNDDMWTCVLVWQLRAAPSKSVPDAMHSKTLRKDSPTPICLSDVLTVFSTRSSRGLEEERTWEIWVIQMIISFFKHRNSKIGQMVKPEMHVQFLTHPERGSQVGTRLHKSLMTRMTMTAEFRWPTLAWRQREKNSSVRWQVA